MRSQFGVIAAGHEVTASAGEEILRAGGNAYDAIIAAVLAATVAEPALASLGGGGFLLAARDGEPSLIYDFFVQTPGRTRPLDALDFYPIQGDFGSARQEFHIGRGSSAVPGFVKGLFELHKDLGRMPFKELVVPAARHARDGVVMSAYQAFVLHTVVNPIFAGSEACMAIYGSRTAPGTLTLEGERTSNPELAAVLENLAHEGPDLFYRGDIAKIIERDMQPAGLVTLADLASYEVMRRKPLKLRYRGTLIEMNPPPAAGGLLIAFGLSLLERAKLQGLVAGSDSYLLLLAEVLERTAQSRTEIEALRAVEDVTATSLDETFLTWYRASVLGTAKAHRGTTHISVIDKDKNMAAMTVSNGEGCGYVVPGTGIHMNNMLGEADLSPAGFMTWEPNTRLSSMMTPTTLLWPDGRRAALGSGGSNRIRTAILQLLVNLIDFEMSAAEAVEAPRIHLDSEGILNVEGGFEGALPALARRFPDMNRWKESNMYFGGTHIASVDEGGFQGAGDPRRDGVCRVL